MQDIDKLPFPNVGNNVFYNKEFSVGNMLPQVSYDKDVITKDLNGNVKIMPNNFSWEEISKNI